MPGRKNLNSQSELLKNFHFKVSSYRRKFASESDSFFQKISFETPIFNEKLCVMPCKIGTKNEKFVVFCWINWVKTNLFRCEFFIITWLLQNKRTQTQFFRKKFSSKIWLIQKFLFRSLPERKTHHSKSAEKKNFKIKISVCRKKNCFRVWFSERFFRIWLFFSKKFISNSDFQWKGLLQNHAS